jgi:hypothetical protein
MRIRSRYVQNAMQMNNVEREQKCEAADGIVLLRLRDGAIRRGVPR